MKRIFAIFLTVLLVLQLAACGGETETPTRSKGSKKPTTEAASSAPDTSAADLASEPETEAPPAEPHTATEPPALKRQELTHLSGVEERWTDPETGQEYIVLEDLGEDGNTRTMNCFDEEGNLIWWESYLYNYAGEMYRKLRRTPQMELLMQEELYWEQGVLVATERYEHFTVGSVTRSSGFLTVEDSYYPNGNVCIRLVYYEYMDVIRDRYEYSEDGQETRHAVYDKNGNITEEYVNGEKISHFPTNVADIFRLLNNDTPDEMFEETWADCFKHMERIGLTEDWNRLCETFSGLMDEYNDSLLYLLREDYRLGLFKEVSSYYHRDKTYNSMLLEWYIQNDEVNPLLFAKIYRMGCRLDFGGTIWLPEEYEKAWLDDSCGGYSYTDAGILVYDWSSNDLRCFVMNQYGFDPLPDYRAAEEAVPEEGIDPVLFSSQLTEGILQKIGTDEETFLESYHAHLEEVFPAPEAALDRKEGDPIRILVLDKSKTILGTAITAEMLHDHTENKYQKIVERAETIYQGLFNGENRQKAILVSYPELADVILEIDTTYPYAGQYSYSNGTRASVYNVKVTVTAYDRSGENRVTAEFSHLAGTSLSVSGGTVIYLKLPDLTSDANLEESQAFTKTVFSWFPDLAE